MSSKSEILARIRRRLPQSTPLPELTGPWITFDDREKQFSEVLSSVGGQANVVANAGELQQAIEQLPAIVGAKSIVCTVPGVDLGNLDVTAVDDPHDLKDVDLAILPGEFGVAENGAVFVRAEPVRHRAIYFLTQHLVLVIPRAAIVDHMHAAYERLKFELAGYGLFISGPSKTADIEQSLVIGAHGPRSLTVLLVGD